MTENRHIFKGLGKFPGTIIERKIKKLYKPHYEEDSNSEIPNFPRDFTEIPKSGRVPVKVKVLVNGNLGNPIFLIYSCEKRRQKSGNSGKSAKLDAKRGDSPKYSGRVTAL